MSGQTAARKIASLIDVGSLQYPSEDKIAEIIEAELTDLHKDLQFCRDTAYETPEMSKENRVGKALRSIYERCCAALEDTVV